MKNLRAKTIKMIINHPCNVKFLEKDLAPKTDKELGEIFDALEAKRGNRIMF